MISLAAVAIPILILAAEPNVQGACTLGQAMQVSAETGNPVVVFVGAEWSPPSRAMRRSTIPEIAESGGLDGVEFVYVDFDDDRKVAQRLLHTPVVPQLIRYDLTDEGWLSQYLVGLQNPRVVTEFVAHESPARLLGRRELDETSHGPRSESERSELHPDGECDYTNKLKFIIKIVCRRSSPKKADAQ